MNNTTNEFNTKLFNLLSLCEVSNVDNLKVIDEDNNEINVGSMLKDLWVMYQSLNK